MNKLKNYKNLYNIYCRRSNPVKIVFWCSLILFVLLFLSMFFSIPDALIPLLVLSFFSAILFGVLSFLPGVLSIKKALAPFSEQQLAGIDREIATANNMNNIYVTSAAIVLNRLRLQICPVDNLLWAYRATTTHKWNSIPVYKDTQLILAGRDKKTYACQIPNKNKVLEFLQQELGAAHRDIIFGYDVSVDRLFQTNINELISLSREKAMKAESAEYTEYIEDTTEQTADTPEPENRSTAFNDTSYLDSLPEQKNKFRVDLLPGEKVVFTAKLICTADTGDVLGMDCKLTLTNQRMLIDNGAGLWTTVIAEDIVSWKHVEQGKGLQKEIYTAIFLNKEITYGSAMVVKLNGYRLAFNKKDMASFEEIMGHVL